MAAAQHHERGDALSPLEVRDSRDSALEHRFVAHEHLLDLGGRDVLTAPDDRVVGAAPHEEEAGLVEVAAIARGEPAVGVDDAACLQVLPRDLRPAHDDVPDLTGHRGAAVHVAHLDFHRRQRTAHRTEPGAYRGVVTGPGLPVVLGAEHRDRGRGLGEAVGVDEPGGGEERQGLRKHLTGDLRTTVGQRPKARGCGPPTVAELGDDAHEHGRHDHRVRDPLLLHRVEPPGGRELVEVDHPAPGVEVGQRVRHRGDVVRRHADERRVGLGHRRVLDRPEDVGGEVPVSQHGTLGSGRCTAGHQQHRDGIGVEVVGGRRLGGGQCQELARADRFQPRRPLRAVRDDQRGALPAENVAERFGAQAVVHRQERDTGQRRGEHRHGEGGPVAAEEDQAVDTLRCEAAAPAIALSRIAAPVRPAVRSPRRTRSAIPSATMSRIIARFIGISRAPFLPH
ncbi:hypothetical protein LUX32_07590 [Actinomadura madurae]|nr:hypothetical protein [Actinomadura madurae]MCP9977519.1 hypothetical protein [Actinomadura madurae]